MGFESEITGMGTLFLTSNAGVRGQRELAVDFYVDYEDGTGVDARWVDTNGNGRVDANDAFGMGDLFALSSYQEREELLSCQDDSKRRTIWWAEKLQRKTFSDAPPFPMRRITAAEVKRFGSYLNTTAGAWAGRIDRIHSEEKRLGTPAGKLACEPGDEIGAGRMWIKGTRVFWAKEEGMTDPFSLVQHFDTDPYFLVKATVSPKSPDYTVLRSAFTACLAR